MRLPDFFIVGAPKSGTTAFDAYLRAHPDVFMAKKELHFFGSDLDFVAPRLTLDRYARELAAAPAGSRCGEASVWYLFSERAASEIKAAVPAARIIVLLRDPVEMLYALHSEFLYNGNEELSDFGEALGAQDDRARGRRLPRTVLLPSSLQYLRTARYAEQLERYFDVFGRDAVLVLLYDEFRRDPRAAYVTVLDFLGLDDDGRTQFPVVNSNRQVRSTRAWRWVATKPPPRLRAAVRALVPTRRARRATRVAIHRRVVSEAPRPAMDERLRVELREHFLPELAALSDLLGRDVTYWVRD